MASKRSSVHEWINSIGVIVAIAIAGASAYFAWQSNEAKKEALSMVVRSVLDCRTEYHGGADAGMIGLCWAVTLSNESEGKLSIVDQRVFDIQDGVTAQIGGFQVLETENGVPLTLPITLDGGEARQIFVRGGVIVPTAVAHAIAQMPEYQNHTLGSLPLAVVQQALALANLDFVGNKVDPIITDGKMLGFSIKSPFTGVVNILTLTTGRNATFSVRMTYPAGFEIQPASGDDHSLRVTAPQAPVR